MALEKIAVTTCPITYSDWEDICDFITDNDMQVYQLLDNKRYHKTMGADRSIVSDSNWLRTKALWREVFYFDDELDAIAFGLQWGFR